MVFFRFRWLHRLIRRHTNPIDPDKAALWKTRLSFLYMVAAWNLLGAVVYYKLYKKDDEKIWRTDSVRPEVGIYSRGKEITHVKKYSGLRKVEEYDYIPGNMSK